MPFNRQHDEPPNTPPAHEPSMAEQFVAATPPLKTFRVTRHRLPSNDVQDSPLESLYVQAHAIGVSDDNRTVFQVWRWNPLAGPHLEVVRLLTGIVDVEEISDGQSSVVVG